MSRKALIITAAIGFVIVITGIIFIFGRKGPSTQTGTQNTEEIAISILPNGWQFVASKPLGISIGVPPVWKVGRISGNIEAILGDGENQELGIGAELIIYSYDNPRRLTPDKWAQEKGTNSPSIIIKNGIEGVSYTAKAVEKYYRDNKYQSKVLDDTYIVGNIFSRENKIIEATCALSGPNYKTMIPTCEEIVKSLQFTR